MTDVSLELARRLDPALLTVKALIAVTTLSIAVPTCV